MKVLILATVWAPYRVQIFNELGKKCDVTVCFEQKKDSDREAEWYEYNSKHFSYVTLKRWDKELKDIKWDVIDVIKKCMPDIVVVYEYHTITSILAMSYCKMKSIPYVVNNDGAFIKKNFKDGVKRYYIKNAAGCLASGEMAKNYYLHYGAKEDRIFIHNFTTLYKKDILTRVLSRDEKKEYKKKLNVNFDKMIFSVGQFIHRKGFDILIKAAAEIDKNIGIYIVGGNMTDEYKMLVEKYNLKNIHFMEFMTSEKLKEYFLAADVFVLPTREDIWGLVINEAMGNGLPVITTNRCVAGLELIENETNGVIVPVEDSEILADKINEIIHDDEKIVLMGRNNLNKIKDYNIEKSGEMIFENIKKIYEMSK